MKTCHLLLLSPLLLGFGAGRADAATKGTLTFEGHVLPGTCELNAGDVNRTIELDPVKVSDFATETSLGKKSFSISANCEAGVSAVTFTFTGTPDATDSWRFANTGTAPGVGLWLYDSADKTIRANNTENTRTVQPNAQGVATLGLGAGYFKVGTVGIGSLKSQVTVNVTYN